MAKRSFKVRQTLNGMGFVARLMHKSLLLAIALSLLVPGAAAHLTVTATGPTEPVQAGVPFVVTASARNLCAVVLAEYQALGETELTFGLAPDGPAYAQVVAAEVAPWTVAQCGTDGYATTTGTFSVILTSAAPALEPLNLTVVAYGNDPSTPEGGDPAILPVEVGFAANGTLSAAQASGDHANHAGEHAMTLALTLNYTINAPALLTIEATSSVGEVHEVEALNLTPPAFDGLDTAQQVLYVGFEPGDNWTSADLTFTAYVTPEGGERLKLDEASLTVHHEHDGDAHGHGDHEHADGEEAPLPSFLLAGGAVALAAMLRSRRLA